MNVIEARSRARKSGLMSAANLAQIPLTNIKAQLFVANVIDQFGLFGTVGTQPDGTPAAPVIGVDVFVQGKCGKKKVAPSRVNIPTVMINSATSPNDLVGLLIDKILMAPDVETTCFDPATLAATPLVGYTLKAVDDFTKRGYYLSYVDPNTGLIVPVKDYAIETEAIVVGLYCKP